jgi:ribulose-5-phosphate 4-epimerase/fuculose-1-phosphate aldolase
MAPALVTEKDVLEFDLEGAPVEKGGPKVYLERFIHGEIYRRRPDVLAVVHSHLIRRSLRTLQNRGFRTPAFPYQGIRTCGTLDAASCRSPKASDEARLF